MIQFVDEAFKLISINSISRNGNEDIASYCQTLMNRMGFSTQLQLVTHSLENVSRRQFNVIGIMGDSLVDVKTKRGLLLVSHLDTFSPGLPEHWTKTDKKPLKASVRDDLIYGLGTGSAKLDFLCKLLACEKYRNRKLKAPLYLVGTAGAGLGGLGARFLTKSVAVNPKYVVTGKPTDLNVIHAEKASALYQVSIFSNQLERDAKGFNTRIELRSTGRVGHGCYPARSDNAILRTLRVLRQILDANFQVRLSRFWGGEDYNLVPDFSGVEFFIQGSSFEDFKKFFRESLLVKNSDEAEQIEVEFGGSGDAGVKFLPENLLTSVEALRDFFLNLPTGLLSSTDDQFDEQKSTVSLTAVQQKPSSVDLYFDVKFLPGVSLDSFESAMKEGIQKLNNNFPSLMFRLLRPSYLPAMNPEKTSTLLPLAKEVQHDLRIGAGKAVPSTTSEASVFANAGFDVIGFGPGSARESCYTANEYVSVEALDKAVHFYDRLIERVCL